MWLTTPRLIFDPGLDDSTMLLDAVYTELSLAYGTRPASLREGQFSVGGKSVLTSTTIAIGLSCELVEVKHFAIVCLSLPTCYSGEGSFVSAVAVGVNT